MKKISFLFLFCMAALLSFASVRTPEEAAKVAARFANDCPSGMVRRAPRMASSMRLAHTRYKQNSENPAFYVFNQGKGEGFIVVSADDRAIDVPVYAEDGVFDENAINPNLKFWLKHLEEELSVLTDDNAVDKSVSRKAVSAIAPLLVNDKGQDIAWYQEDPFNDLCPIDQYDNTRSLTGCVATATAQIMYKWRYPDKGTGSKTYTWEDCLSWNTKTWVCNRSKDVQLTANFGATTYDWDNILAKYTKSATTAQKNAVATLMYHCGVACEMMYGCYDIGGSGAWTDDMVEGLTTYFGYTYTKFISTYKTQRAYEYDKEDKVTVTSQFGLTADDFVPLFNADLEAGRPILMGGEDTIAGGHEFVCDGRDTRGYFHINWGWGGTGNCYCQLTLLRPSSSSYDFSTNIDAVIGLKPKNLTPISVTGIKVTPTTATIKKKGKVQLSAEIQPSNATVKVVSWTSDNSLVAMVSESGLVTGIAAGVAHIKATTKDGSFSASCTVTVSNEEETVDTDITDLDYLDAYYFTENGQGYWDFNIYRAVGAGGYPDMYIYGLHALSKNKLAGTYESDWAVCYFSETDSVSFEYISLTITRLEGLISVYNLPKYSVEGTAMGEDGNTYTISATIGGSAYDYVTEGEITLKDVVGDEPSPTGEGFVLVTDASSLLLDDEIIIVSATEDVAMSKTQNNNNRGTASVDKEGDTVTPSNNVQILTLKKGKQSNTYAFYTGDGYLCACSSSRNYLRTEASLSDNSSWKIAIKNGTAVVESVGSYTRNTIMYNAQDVKNCLFSCYLSSKTDMDAIEIYRKNKALPSAMDVAESTSSAKKVVENGKVVIIRRGVRYNVMGIRL